MSNDTRTPSAPSYDAVTETPPRQKLVKVLTPWGLHQRAAHRAVDEDVSVAELYRRALRAYLAPRS